ncbi:hypothetical protein F4680DRAFT_443835 [Xylaria scruposa]|nr:hypothetical protein F4680DRAFT_443835 [Xylaria scruposa]
MIVVVIVAVSLLRELIGKSHNDLGPRQSRGRNPELAITYHIDCFEFLTFLSSRTTKVLLNMSWKELIIDELQIASVKSVWTKELVAGVTALRNSGISSCL